MVLDLNDQKIINGIITSLKKIEKKVTSNFKK